MHLADPLPDYDGDGETPPPTPRWVKLFGIILAVLVLIVVILHLSGNGLGGHSMHRP